MEADFRIAVGTATADGRGLAFRKQGYFTSSIKMGDLALPDEGVKVEARFFTPEQVRKIINLAAEPFRTMFCILDTTGIRAGELLGLKAESRRPRLR